DGCQEGPAYFDEICDVEEMDESSGFTDVPIRARPVEAGSRFVVHDDHVPLLDGCRKQFETMTPLIFDGDRRVIPQKGESVAYLFRRPFEDLSVEPCRSIFQVLP